MEITLNDERAHTATLAVTLTAEEVEELGASAWGRLARILKTDVASVRTRATGMLTDNEQVRYLQETVMAKAAEQALRAFDIEFMLTPEVSADTPLVEGEEFSFHVTAHRVPDMNIDLETPADSGMPPRDPQAEITDYDRKRARRLLKARLNGTVPEPLVKAAMKLREQEFQRELYQQGLTYREWRIQNNMKPKEVEAMMREETIQQLFEEIALDLAFFRNGLEAGSEEERVILAEMAPGRESALFEDLADAGRVCLLKQKARRYAAEQWAVEHLL